MKTKNLAFTHFSGIRTSLLFVILILAASCVNNIDDDSDEEPYPDFNEPTTAQAIINTRTNVEGIPPVYPVRIYAFNAAGKCTASQTVSGSDDNIALPLPAGTYTIYALAGATNTRYKLPDAETITSQTTLELIENNGLHDELQTDHATITLEDGETENLTLTMERVVAGITVEMKGLPEDITTCTITLQPLKPGVKLDGTYTAEASAKSTIALTATNNADGTWSTNTPQFVLPGTDKTTITIGLTTTEGTKQYSYSSNIIIEAGYQISIQATYLAGTPQLLGTITGTDWKGSQTISFDFGSHSGNGDGSGESPHPGFDAEEGDIYHGCYVLSVTSTQAILLAPNEATFTGSTQNPLAEQIAAYLSTYSNQAGNGWQLPTTQQATRIHNSFAAINKVVDTSMDANNEYVFADGNGILRFFGQNEAPSDTQHQATNAATYTIRPVKIINL